MSDGTIMSEEPLAWPRQFCKGQQREQEEEECRERDGKTTQRTGQDLSLVNLSERLTIEYD